MAASGSTSSTSTLNDNSSNTMNNFPNTINLMPIKLDDTNYLNWKHQTLLVLKSLGLLSFLNKDILPPTDAAARVAWGRSDAYVSAFIIANLSSSLIHVARGFVKEAEDTRERFKENGCLDNGGTCSGGVFGQVSCEAMNDGEPCGSIHVIRVICEDDKDSTSHVSVSRSESLILN